MKFRPCIDIHNGKVKQLIGGSLSDKGETAEENYVSERDCGYYARLYSEKGLYGGHAIILNSKDSEYYEEDRRQVFAALEEFPHGLQVGGGVTAENAEEYIKRGASHVIVTSYVFSQGRISFDRLKELVNAVGSDKIVLDLSCRKRDGRYYIVTDRWQNFTEFELTKDNVLMLKSYCDEFLVHAVDAEGKQKGIEEGAAALLGSIHDITATYAGGISSYEDIETLKRLGSGRIDFTIGSALDLFGGQLKFDDICRAYSCDYN